MSTEDGNSTYAIRTADESYAWYRKAAIRARRAYRISEIAIVAISALIPVSAAALPGQNIITAALGSSVVIISGLKALFHWQENYFRFSHSREAVETERRKYRTGTPPYNDQESKATRLVQAVTQIEQAEMGQWLKIASAQQSDQGQNH